METICAGPAGRKRIMSQRLGYRLIGSLTILGLVAGCSITPEPMSSEDRSAWSVADLKRINQKERPAMSFLQGQFCRCST